MENHLPARDQHDPLGGLAIDVVHQMDCLEGMRRLPTDSIDIAIADPPYNASKGGNWTWRQGADLPGMGGDWSKIMAAWDDMPLADYFQFTTVWAAELHRVVRPEGAIWIHGTYHNIGIVNFALQLLGIEIINEIVWYKRNSFPNLSGRRLTASHETILWCHTGGAGDRRYRFNYDQAKQMECPEDPQKTAGKQMRTVWDVPNNKRRQELAHGKHPAQKPLRLVERMLRLCGRSGDLVLSPFAGGGTDCVAAARAGMQFIGFETEPEYIELCNRRLHAEREAAPRTRREKQP